MRGEVLIGSTISAEAVQAWRPSSANTITFQIRRASAFDLFADIDALVRIHQLQQTATQIDVEFSFDQPRDFVAEFLGPGFGAASGLFGLALLLSARTISFRDGTADIALPDRLWEAVLARNASISSNLRRYVVFRDPDYPIPSCLPTRNFGFPYPTVFKKLLRDIFQEIPELGHRGIGTDTSEDRLLSFLYETVRNAHEHARPRLPNRRISEIRGITIEKRESSTLHGPEGLRVPLEDYLTRSKRHFGAFRHIIVISVVDLGSGIQSTLPAREGETPKDRLTRAITTPASSKPSSSDTTRGLGLPNVITAAQRLRAFLLFSSAGLAAYVDGSAETPPPSLRHVEATSNRSGTAVSLIWPLLAHSTDQVELFSRQ